MKKEITDKINEFFKGDSYKKLSKGEDSFAKKLRTYNARWRKNQLKPIAALSLLIDCDEVEQIIFK